jgi:hypothetical protein
MDKARRAGVSRVFIGLENVNPDNLQAAHKNQNKVAEYRTMLLEWKRRSITTYCGYILGFSGDTPQRILEDIETVKRELPLDILEFFFLTPLPGSEDHKELQAAGAPLEPDMNCYDLEHACMTHPRMSADEWRGVYDQAWSSYYSMEHLETLMRRALAAGRNPRRVLELALQFYGCYRYLRVHPLQGGYFRRKVRTERRAAFPRENPIVFYPRRVLEFARTYGGFAAYAFRVFRLLRRVQRDTRAATEPWIDDAMGDFLVKRGDTTRPCPSSAE